LPPPALCPAEGFLFAYRREKREESREKYMLSSLYSLLSSLKE
jgi:hypothetical protein